MPQVAVDAVVVEERLYPRQKLDEHNVQKIARAYREGFTLPAILLEEDTLRLVDGRHRLQARINLGLPDIEATLKVYASEAELYSEAVFLNAIHGAALTEYDKVKVAEQGTLLGIPETDLARAMRTSVEQLRAISKRFAFSNEDLPELRRHIPLKSSTRHLVNQRLTDAQIQALDTAPGMSYLLLIRQLIDGLNFQLIPPVESNPALWVKLRELKDAIGLADIPPAVNP